MPGKNGIDVLKLIRSHHELKQLPVFLFTALMDTDSKEVYNIYLDWTSSRIRYCRYNA